MIYSITGLQYYPKNFVGQPDPLLSHMNISSCKLALILILCLSSVSSLPCGDNCADCGGDSSVCYACQPSFQLSVLSKCNPETTNDKCILYGPGKTCFVCQPTFQIQNSKCTKHYTACLNFLNGNCLECGFGTLLEEGSCVGTVNCDKFEKSCSKCANGFTLKNNKCYPDQGCKSFDQTIGVCKQCNSGFDMVGYQCIESSQKVYDCYIYNRNLTCSNCKYGFIPYEGQCLLPDDIQALQTGAKKMPDILMDKKAKYDAAYAQNSSPQSTPQSTQTILPPQPAPFSINNCRVPDPVNKICALCEDRYYRSGSQCLKVKDTCRDYDMVNGQCTSCNQGLILLNGDCFQKPVQQPLPQTPTIVPGGAVIIPTPKTQPNSQANQPTNTNTAITTGTISTVAQPQTSGSNFPKDPNCLKMESNKCIQCSNRFFLSPDGICVPVNPLCQSYNVKGACKSCYKGYKISGDACIAAQQKDPYCKQTDQANICKACFDGFFVNSTKSCQPLNPLCKSSDLSNGKCISCYMGYTLVDGTCKIFVRDPNCQEYDASSNCIKCPSRFYLNQGSCRPVSPLCKDFDRITGLCTECYPGYVNDKGICAIATSKTEDLSCKQKKNGLCVSCYNGFYLNSNSNRCELQNLICKTINTQNGNCQSCYNGYVIQGTTCVLASLETSDIYCKQFDANKRCAECYSGYFVDPTGVCKQFDPTCKQSDKKTGACISCYSGFNLLSGKCASDVPALGLNADQYCIKIDGTKCLQCNKGYFVALNNVCTQVDILCKTYSLENGFCTSCYTGYVLSNGKCILGQDLYIPFCKKSNSQGKCVQCNDRYYLSKDVCTPVSLLCDSYSQTTGKCITCTPGYFFQNEQCIFPALGVDPGCIFYTNSYCTKCKPSFYLQNFFCKQIDSRCLDFNYTRNLCTKCHNSNPQGPACA